MLPEKSSGQAPFIFAHREDLYNLPSLAKECVVNLHGGFAVDTWDGYGWIGGMAVWGQLH